MWQRRDYGEGPRAAGARRVGLAGSAGYGPRPAGAGASLALAVCTGGRGPARARRWPRGRPGCPGPAWAGGGGSCSQPLGSAGGGCARAGAGLARSGGRSRARRLPPGPGGAEVRAGPVVSAATVRAAVKAARGGSVRVTALLDSTEFACKGAGEVGVFIRELPVHLRSEFKCILACRSCHKREVMSLREPCRCARVARAAGCRSVIPDPADPSRTFLVNLLSPCRKGGSALVGPARYSCFGTNVDVY